MKKLILLFKGDIKNLRRDSITLMLMLSPILLTFAIKLMLPFIDDILQNEMGFNLEEYHELIISIMILVIPMLLGMVTGFIILDERDENILSYLSVTPLSRTLYIVYRVTFPAILSFILTYFFIAMTGFVSINYIQAVPLILIISMEAPLSALFLGAFAGNKVEGLALSKAMGIFLLAPLVGYFVKSNWQYLAGIFPTYWIPKAFLARWSISYEYWMYTACGMFMHVIALFLLLKRFKNRIL